MHGVFNPAVEGVFYIGISRPGMMSLGRNHRQNSVPVFIEGLCA